MADQLIAYGGAGLSRDQLNAKLEALQAHWSVGLGGIVLEAPRRNIDAALDILLAAWTSPALPESEFARLKAGSIAGVEAALKDPGQVVANAASLRFDNYPASHPLRPRPLQQQLADSRAVSFADVTACVADLSGIAHVRLALVGAFSAADAHAVWAKVAALPAATIPYARVKDVAAPQSVDTTPIKVVMAEKPNAAIAGSALLPITDDSPDFPALRIAVKALGGDADSRIWKRLREREGLAYSAGVILSGSRFEPRSRLSIQASAASDKSDAALASLQDELARALKDGFSAPEVERAKRAWLQERKTSLRDEQSFAGSLAEGLYSGRDYAWLARYDEKIARLAAPEVTAALRKYLAETPMVWTIGRGSERAAQAP
jgi:zinc protease